MNLYNYLKLSTKDKLIYCCQISPSEIEIDPDIKLIYEIYINTINSCKLFNIDLVNLLIDNDFNLPSMVKSLYEGNEDTIISHLPYSKWEESHHKLNDLKSKLRKETEIEKQRIFEESKLKWTSEYADFKRISDIMENYKTNELLVEYCKHSPPPSLQNRAIEIYKKCISYKEKFTKKIISQLTYHPDRTEVHRSYARYCIDKNIVKTFLNEYQLWNHNICSLWNEIYYSKQDFFQNSGYDRLGWKFYIEHPNLLKIKADETEKLYQKIMSILIPGNELLDKLDNLITKEYETNATEMSWYERELEILQMWDSDTASDEEYCYVYTLECELFVFYVGIAANPKERFEQHIRGAFSDEAHLFKSKFIQKYHKEVKQNLVYEGLRRDCKKFEKEYISKYRPLGNMTEGGEG